MRSPASFPDKGLFGNSSRFNRREQARIRCGSVMGKLPPTYDVPANGIVNEASEYDPLHDMPRLSRL